MAKKLKRKSYQESMADYPRIVSMTNYSPSTGTAAKVSWAPEQGNCPSLSTTMGMGIFNKRILSHTGNLYYFIVIVFSTKYMSAKLHILMVHWYFRQHFKYIYLYINRSIY